MIARAPKQKLKASDLLTPAEVKKLISVTPDMRLKALMAVCYECGLRVGEESPDAYRRCGAPRTVCNVDRQWKNRAARGLLDRSNKMSD